VSQILVGLHRVGLVGLMDALKGADESGLTESSDIVDHIFESLRESNYIPDSHMEAYRQAIWREFLRYRGEDISDFYSEMDVTVRGVAGEERDRFVEMMTSVFGDFELKPRVDYAAPGSGDSKPELLIDDDPVVRGIVSRHAFKAAVQRRISEW
jgi:hypothetical protein